MYPRAMGPLLTDEWLTVRVRRRIRKNSESVNSALSGGEQ